MNQAFRLSLKPSWSSRRSLSSGLAVQGRPEAYRFAHLDPLLELRLLKLHADPLLQGVSLSRRIQSEDRDGAAIGCAETLDALHRRGLAGAVWSDQPENLSGLHFE